jgi:His-Xaa-Ser system radical SAM maturase HxsB
VEIREFKPAETYKQFKDLSFYENKDTYKLFPFNFSKLDEDYILTNDIGEFIICSKNDLHNLIKKELTIEDNKELFFDLLNKQFIYIGNDKEAISRKAVKYRTKKQFLYTGAVLLVFVVTTRCQHKCHYCQITPQSTKAIEYDMTEEVAKKSVEMAMQAPSQNITIEFQGGETLLAFDKVKFVVQYVKELNKKANKNIEFVLATSLVDITREQLEFIKEHGILLSTSLDGPEDLHNLNRPIHSQNTYKKFLEGYTLSKEYVGDTISPLLTISKNSLSRIEDILNEYQKFGQKSISLRALSPYGFAVKTMSKIGYSAEEYIDFYLNALDYIIEMNLNGTYFREEYATLLLRRILTPYSTGYVDLQSPSGAGVNALVFYYNGEIYPADEARMLAEMGDKNFLLGNIFEDSYKDIINSPKLQLIIQDSCAESLTNCSECAYLPYCGCDPLFNYVTQQDHYGHRPSSDFCYKQTKIYDYLFSYIQKKDKKVLDIFWAWINHDIDFIEGKY